jgi:hypothetical protein
MKKLWLALIFCLPAIAQISNPSIISVTTAPSGPCTAGLPNQQVVSTGTQYSCQSGTWGAIGGGGGSGTVTSVSVTTANGVSGSVATATTTPAISLTLGAITPSSVAATGPVSGTTGTFSAGVTSSSDGTHAGIMALVGNTLNPIIPANQFGFLGFASASATAYFYQPNATAPTVNQLLQVSASSGGVLTLSGVSRTWNATDGVVSTAALATSGFPAVVFGVNKSGATQTIASILCFVDAGTTTTFTLVDSSANNLLNTTGACSTTGTSNTLSATTTLASAAFMKYVLTPDGTAKAVTLVVSGTL